MEALFFVRVTKQSVELGRLLGDGLGHLVGVALLLGQLGGQLVVQVCQRTALQIHSHAETGH